MGILREPADAVRRLARDHLPHGFSVCELGDQWLTYGKPHVLSKDFFEQELKAGCYRSLDGNGRATNVFDLNERLTSEQLLDLDGPFDLVTDYGTGEHIFDQVQLWRTIHALMAPRGFFAFDRPSQGYPAHCYYRTDRCYWDDIIAANAYEVVWIAERVRPNGGLLTYRGDLIRGIVRKTAYSPKFFQIPQQGRYHKLLRPIMESKP